jgi:hypothetical protein
MTAKKPRKESNEEQQFEAWLIEAQEHGLVDRYGKQPKFELIQGERVGGKFLHREHNYTGDFKVWLTELGEEVLRGVFEKSDILGFPNGLLYVDTKGSFQSYGGGRAFSINQKLVREKHGVWVAKVVPWIGQKTNKETGKVTPPKGLFVDTWCPNDWRWMKDSCRRGPKHNVMGRACKTVAEFRRGMHKEEMV